MDQQCAYCHKPIFGEYLIAEGKSYHNDCYHGHVALKCTFCLQEINGLYYTDYWGNISCDRHPIVHCSSCARMFPQKGGTSINDRKYCPKCSATAIHDSNSTSKALQEILAIYHRYGIRNMPGNVPVYIVNKTSLLGLAGPSSSGDTLGLAKSSATWSGLGGPKSFTHEIYILGGLPYIEFESVLAHEMLHTWLNEFEVIMSAPETEGFCNLGSYLVLSLNPAKHAKILMKSIQESSDPVYGAGYRKMYSILQQKGWTSFLDDIKNGR